MSIELKFDWKRFGCNEQAVKELVEEIARCVNEAKPNAANHFGHDITTSPPKPEGVYVKPGMRVLYGASEVTVAPWIYGNAPRDGVCIWWDDATHGYALTIDKYLTYKDKPVLGYEEDRP